ncbi:MAG: ABC transporter permease [Chloroflexi bacterium]|nr:ABC transporter permease [Chloroflexota bacterium]
MTAEATAEVRSARRTEPRRRAGWLIVARKELADHLVSARFVILLLVLGAATLIPLYLASDAIREVANRVTDTRGAFLLLFLATSGDSPVPNVLTFVAIVAPLLGVAFAFDAINSERADGTLPRLLSQPIYRDDVINGKFAAGLGVIALVMFAVFSIISGFGIFRLGIIPSGDDLVRLVAWYGITVVWVGLWLALGLVLSVTMRRAANAALAGFGIWIAVAIFGRLVVEAIAGALAPISSATNLQEQLDLAGLSQAILRVLPLTLFQEASAVLLRPDLTTISNPATIDQLEQLGQQLQGQYLPFSQSALLIWPHVVALVAMTAVCFAAAYIWFMRQEVRA